MTRRPLITAALIGAVLASGAACSAASAEESPLVGEWRMTQLEVGTEGDLAPVPYSGQIIFTTDTVSVQR